MLSIVAEFGSQFDGKFIESLLLCVVGPTLVNSLHCVLVSGSSQRQCLASKEPLDMLVQEGPKPIGVAVH